MTTIRTTTAVSTGHLWDVVIVGAGPAGSSAARWLAKDGHRVLVLEREHFPRFHIGESLLPAGVAFHAELGLEDDPDAFVYKGGAQFVCEATGRHSTFSFSESLEGPPRHAYQVDRALFDTRLRDLALAAGAEVRHGEKVTGVTIDDDRVRVTTQTGGVQARYLVDATGQDRLLARKNRTALPYEHFGKAAIYTHFEGLGDAAMAEIGPDHDIRIMVTEHGWGWFIPLPGRRLSVGIVNRRPGAHVGWMDEYIASSPMLQRWTVGATRGETKVVRNFSYRNTKPSGARFACIGDAGCFLDPVFSSGVALAMKSAADLVEALSPALANRTEASPTLHATSEARMIRGYETFGAMIGRFYHTRFADNFFFSPPQDTRMRQGVISVLAGDVWRDDNPFQDMLLRARRQPTPSPMRAPSAPAPASVAAAPKR